LVGVFGGGDGAAVDEADGLFGTHDAELGVRPGEDEVGAQFAAVHAVLVITTKSVSAGE
jgi:hypothetical protein